MTEPQDKPIDLGIYGRDTGLGRLSVAELLAIAVGLVWVAGVTGYALTTPTAEGEGGALATLMTVLVVVLPLALIWAAVATLRAVRTLREEAKRLQAAVDAMRNAYVASQQTQAAALLRRDDAPPRLESSGAVAARPVERRAAAPRPAPAEEQPTLALGTPPEDARPPLSVADFILSLNFPDTPDDIAGIQALRLALADRGIAKLIRAAQDVLTLLSQEGIYMDDLAPDRPRAEVWRRFAAGERGRSIAGLGGIRDRASLALTATRMREDPIFRDAAHHFLRTFDRTFSEMEKAATDGELVELANTRTARAFMLFGRVTGTFD
ncbi:MAG: hypothetical protein V7668_02305 [Cereibacter changlensis]